MLHRKQIFTNQHSALLQVDPNHPLSVGLQFYIPSFTGRQFFYDPVRTVQYRDFALTTQANRDNMLGHGPQDLYACFPNDYTSTNGNGTVFSTTLIDSTLGFTFSCWLKSGANANVGYVGAFFNTTPSLVFSVDGVTSTIWNVSCGGATSLITKDSNCKWQHIVGTWDNIAGRLTGYSNGTFFSTTTTTTISTTQFFWRFFSNSAASTTNNLLRTNITLMGAWNRPITADEVAILYQDPVCMLECSPEWYYYNPDLIAARLGIGKSPFRNFIHGER